jgi:glyoxylase-like metal-dependent hydrolase (beta-lactamase superfamily II)
VARAARARTAAPRRAAGRNADERMLREVVAPNASPMTLDGTRTFLVGRRRMAIIDPGPADPDHLDAVVRAAAGGVIAAILPTHDHPDHAGGAAHLAERLGARVRRLLDGTLADGDRIDTDAGPLVVVATPGHTPDHAAFHWPARGDVFVGDLLMGGLPTALVAWPEGNLADYLASLERVRALRPRVLHPAHGPSFDAPDDAIDAYVRHRRARERQVLDALAAGRRGAADIADAVYGADLPAALRGAAADAVRAYLAHLERTGRLPGGGAPAEPRP